MVPSSLFCSCWLLTFNSKTYCFLDIVTCKMGFWDIVSNFILVLLVCFMVIQACLAGIKTNCRACEDTAHRLDTLLKCPSGGWYPWYFRLGFEFMLSASRWYWFTTRLRQLCSFYLNIPGINFSHWHERSKFICFKS